MTKRSADQFFTMMTNPRLVAWTVVLTIAIVTAIVVIEETI